jgi:hypothetical protein
MNSEFLGELNACQLLKTFLCHQVNSNTQRTAAEIHEGFGFEADHEHNYKLHMKHSCLYKITNLAMPRKCMRAVICSSRNYTITQWEKGRK